MSQSDQTETDMSSIVSEILSRYPPGSLKSFEDLAREQGVKPMTNFDALMGVWPEDERDDGFEEAVLRWRREALVGTE